EAIGFVGSRSQPPSAPRPCSRRVGQGIREADERVAEAGREVTWPRQSTRGIRLRTRGLKASRTRSQPAEGSQVNMATWWTSLMSRWIERLQALDETAAVLVPCEPRLRRRHSTHCWWTTYRDSTRQEHALAPDGSRRTAISWRSSRFGSRRTQYRRSGGDIRNSGTRRFQRAAADGSEEEDLARPDGPETAGFHCR